MVRMRYLVLLLVVLLFASAEQALACGGFFCQNSPVDQNAERIIFTQNRDGTISAYIQIQYTGTAPDFSWVLPLPAAISAEDLEVPEDAMAAFNELEIATNPVFIAPPMPECAQVVFEEAIPAAGSGEVTVFASGEVGPYGFDVVGSDDPLAMINWLREHQYRVTPEMEPLIDVYVQEKFVFLAMRLLPDAEAADVQPIKITYPSSTPMIPLRLTAVAANPDMRVLAWIFADKQAIPQNYAHMEIADEEITFFTFGGNNYRQLISDRANEFGGQAFITEYAAPTNELSVTHPLLQTLRGQYAYMTRLSTVISPEEMTVDPIFSYDPQRRDVSNVHDLSNLRGVWDCEQDTLPTIFTNPNSSNPTITTLGAGVLLGCLGVFFLIFIFGVGLALGRRSRQG
ncbi:MAG: DUF2330 domain-containing protein [Anaerolineales bacterium]|nr:DUF2330 domain-containing protein [Anaerolineales bacterium]